MDRADAAVKGPEQEMDKAHRGGKIVNLVAGRRSVPGLYILSGQQLFETLPPFRIEGKTWLCST
jgi:hypothetical protein